MSDKFQPGNIIKFNRVFEDLQYINRSMNLEWEYEILETFEKNYYLIFSPNGAEEYSGHEGLGEGNGYNYGHRYFIKYLIDRYAVLVDVKVNLEEFM